MILRRRRRLALVAVLRLALAIPSHAAASYLYIDYHAGPTTPNSTPTTVWTPAMWGWVDLNAGPAGAGVVNPLGTGMNAWRITDSTTSIPNPAYVSALSSSARTDAARDGWRLSSTARYVSDFGAAANMGLSAYIGNRAYHLMLDLTAGGDLQATLYDETARVYRLTTGGVGATAFHRFELQNTPGTSIVAFEFDGLLIDVQWNGIALAHPGTVQWGNSNQSLANRGTMEFQEVLFEIGPFANQPGDFDGDADADGHDLLAWQRTLGSTIDRAADANNDGRIDDADLTIWRQSFGDTAAVQSIPEPNALLIVLNAVVATSWMARLQKKY